MSFLKTLGKLFTQGQKNGAQAGAPQKFTTKPLPAPAPTVSPGQLRMANNAAAPVAAPVAPQQAPAAPAGVQLSDLLNAILAPSTGGLTPPPVPPAAVTTLTQAAPNKDSYLAPFVQADGAARDSYNASQPVINGSFDQLRQRLADTLSAGQADNTKRAADAASQQEQLRQSLAALTGGVGSDLAKQGVIPSLAGNVAAQAAAQQANLTLQSGQQAGLFKDMAARAQVDNSGRVQDAAGAQAAAQANSRNNLDAILAQIGVGKAGAERQFQQDQGAFEQKQQAVQQANVAAQADHDSKVFQQQLQAAQQNHADSQQQLKYMQAVKQAQTKALVSPRDQFDQSMPDRAQQYPKATTAFNDIVKAGGTAAGGAGLAKALTALNKAKTDPQGFAKAYGFVPNEGSFSTLEQWLRAYYDGDKKIVDEDKLQQALSDISFAT